MLPLVLFLIGCETPVDHHYHGTVAEIVWTNPRYSSCATVYFLKDDGTTTDFSVYGWPPTWKGMHGWILLRDDGTCGYSLVSAKEDK